MYVCMYVYKEYVKCIYVSVSKRRNTQYIYVHANRGVIGVVKRDLPWCQKRPHRGVISMVKDPDAGSDGKKFHEHLNTKETYHSVKRDLTGE
jgi:hypothetical protein